MMAKETFSFNAIHIVPPSSPKKTNICNPARRIQLKRNLHHKYHEDGQVYIIKPKKVDYTSQIQYYKYLRKKHYFIKWKKFYRVKEYHKNSPSRKETPESSFFQLEISDSESDSDSGEISNIHLPKSPARDPGISKQVSKHARHLSRNKNNKENNTDNNTININNISDDISKFIEAGIHPPTPMIMPPRRDSQIKGFLREIISPKLFHITQLQQKKKLKLPIVKLPKKVSEPWANLPDICDLIIDVVNEVNTKMDLSEFFYELYLEMLEDSLNSQDPILYRMIFPFEIAQDEFESNDIEQVKCVLEISDNILHEQKNKILGL